MVGFLLTRGHPAEQKPAGVRLGNATVRVVSEVCHALAELVTAEPRHEAPDRFRCMFLPSQRHPRNKGRADTSLFARKRHHDSNPWAAPRIYAGVLRLDARRPAPAEL